MEALPNLSSGGDSIKKLIYGIFGNILYYKNYYVLNSKINGENTG